MSNQSHVVQVRRNSRTGDVEAVIESTSVIDLSPTTLADTFWQMDDEYQALFFNRLGEIGTNWPMQLQAVTDNPGLNDQGRQIMATIGEYAEKQEA